MSMYYRIVGSLWFASEEDAKQSYDKLTKTEDSIFYYFTDNLQLDKEKITFGEDGNFTSYSSVEITKDVINQIAAQARHGKIKIDEGNGENDLWNSFYVTPPPVDMQPGNHRQEMFYYHFTGSVLYNLADEAKAACDRLLNDITSAFSLLDKTSNPVCISKDKRLIIECENQCLGAIYLDTEHLIEEVIKTARSGAVKFKFSYYGDSYVAMVTTPARIRKREAFYRKRDEKNA